MKDTKEYILEKAFALFLEKGYDGVSITDLQREIGMGRASLYHHFKGKKELFTEVVEKVFISMGETKHFSTNPDLSLWELLESNIKRHKEALAYHNSMPARNISMLNYYLLGFQATRHCPGFGAKSRRIHEKELLQYKTAIAISIKKGEIREDTDMDKTAKMIVHAEKGIGIESTYSTSMEQIIEQIEEMYQFIYSLIRK